MEGAGGNATDGSKASDGKPRTTVDLLDQSQKSLAKLVSDSEKNAEKATATSSGETSEDARSSDSKGVERAYAAYAAYDTSEKKAA